MLFALVKTLTFSAALVTPSHKNLPKNFLLQTMAPVKTRIVSLPDGHSYSIKLLLVQICYYGRNKPPEEQYLWQHHYTVLPVNPQCRSGPTDVSAFPLLESSDPLPPGELRNWRQNYPALSFCIF